MSEKTWKRRVPFSRRTFLRGAGGVIVGLPMLDVFGRSRAEAQAQGARRFGVFVRQANGVAQAGDGEPERFWPKALGALTTAQMQSETDRGVVELASYADKLLLVKGTRFAFPGNGCGHSGGGNQVLTAAKVSEDPSGEKSLALGESIDNRMAREINPDGREPLTLMTGNTSGYLPVVLSYRGPKMLRGADNDPFVVYKRMTGLTGMDAGAVDEIATRRKSVNDLIREQLRGFLGRNDLSTNDRQRLDLHFSSIRDFEVRMACTLPDMRQRELDGVSPVDGKNYVQVTQMHMDLIALSFACDYSRVATLQMGQGNDATQHSIPGFRGGEKLPRFHQISHRIYGDGTEGDPIDGAQEMHFEIDKLHGRLFKYLIDRLAAYSTPEGTLLDSGFAVWTNDLAHGVSHGYRNVPWVFAGSCGGFLKQGQYVDAGNVTHNKLFNTLLEAVGVKNSDGTPVDDFGDPSLSKGQIDVMKA
jgi:Protein of unknown function (DUF1552)